MTVSVLIESAVILAGGSATVFGILMQWRNRGRDDRSADAKLGIDKATKNKIVLDAAHSVEQDYLNRLGEFRTEISQLNAELNIERERAAEWRDRVTMLEDFFFSKHMPWDRKMTLVAREQGWTVEDPPSIMSYLREVESAGARSPARPRRASAPWR